MIVRARHSQATLLFRPTCPACRRLALLAQWASLGLIERQPLGGDQVQALYEKYPETRGRLALLHGSRVFTGPFVVLGSVRVVLSAVVDWIKRCALHSP